MKILCVEDDKNLSRLLETTLVGQHYQVEVATDGQLGWDLVETFTYDLILLDLILPKLDGIRFCQQLRSHPSSACVSPNHDTPVLLMTALDTVTNKVMGLDAGADDYVTKPLDLDELMARIRALLRRNQANRSPILEWGDLCLNPNSCEVRFREQIVTLASKEYEILELFLRNPDQIFSPSRLLDRLWVADEFPSEGAVRSHIKGLRQKLKQAGADDIFETIYKLGYRLKPQSVLERGKEDEGDRGDGADRGGKKIGYPASAPLPVFSMDSDVWEAWLECRQAYCDRLSIIQSAVVSLQAGNLTPQEKQNAERQAHTLSGSLGSFGLSEASHLSRQILQLLKQEEPFSKFQVDPLVQLVTALQHQIETYGSENTEDRDAEDRDAEDRDTEDRENEEIVAARYSSAALAPNATTLLIVDNDIALVKQLATEASAWGIQTQTATSLAQARQCLTDQCPDAILLDLNFSGSSPGGLAFLAELQAQYANIPVLVFTAEQTLTGRVEATQLGCQYFLQKPIAPAQVMATVVQALQQVSPSVDRLLIVDDDPNLLQLLHTLLTPQGYQVTLLDQPRLFWQTLEQTNPDLVILDVDLHDNGVTGSLNPLSGLDLCRVIRSDPRWNRLPILFLSAHLDAETIHQGYAAKADDFLCKPVVPASLLTRIQTRLEQRKLWGMTDVDELTGVSLRRKTLQDLTRLLHLARRQHQPLSIAILDLDHFKRVNDEYGHKAGDQVLCHLGRLLLHSLRVEDVVGRWGGEEFVVGMYGITKQDGIKRLNEVLHQLRQHIFSDFGETNSPPFSVTFSAGVAQFSEDGDDWQTLYQVADAALYRAKAQGRNRIFAAETQ